MAARGHRSSLPGRAEGSRRRRHQARTTSIGTMPSSAGSWKPHTCA